MPSQWRKKRDDYTTTFPQCGSKGQATEEIRFFFLFLIFECFKNKTSPPERIGPFRHLTMGKPAGGLNKIYKKKRGENEEEDG